MPLGQLFAGKQQQRQQMNTTVSAEFIPQRACLDDKLRKKTRSAPKSGGQQSSSHNMRGDPFNLPRVAASQRRTRIDIPLHQQVQDNINGTQRG